MNRVAVFSSLLIAPCLLLGCTKPGKTTAIGSGVGGAMGAGLGAIIGNQTGSAGGGVAIGAVAGAATGALIGNALQAQDEKSRSQDEAIKRQEKTLQAQRNELAELRALKSDSASYPSSSDIGPRYRYRSSSIDENSPEVARRIAELQRRGPNPKGQSTSTAWMPEPKPARASLPKTSAREPLARYDVRSEISSQKLPAKTTHVAKSDVSRATSEGASQKAASIQNSVPLIKETLPKPRSIQETNLETRETAAALAAPSSSSSECKEAMSEKELASQAPDNSDKLFHLRRALRLCPNNAVLHYELGNVYRLMERTTNAEEEFKQALSIDPNLVPAKNAMADMLKNETKF
ncbi:MAG: Glycine zipper [Pseudomonadota bacterium]